MQMTTSRLLEIPGCKLVYVEAPLLLSFVTGRVAGFYGRSAGPMELAILLMTDSYMYHLRRWGKISATPNISFPDFGIISRCDVRFTADSAGAKLLAICPHLAY